LGEISSAFELKNMISTFTHGFSWKNGSHVPNFKEFFSKSPNFYDKLE
jgi:hypothetical protein